jgi:hypothetical protein
MRRTVVFVLIALLVALVTASAASAFIHPIVESIDCAQASGLANRPSGGDVADPPGQLSTGFAALSHAGDSAFSSFKAEGTCGAGP